METKQIVWLAMIPVAIIIVIILSKVLYGVVRKKPKNFGLMNLPIILYPYAYMLILIPSVVFQVNEMIGYLFLLFVLIHPLVWACLLADFKLAKEGIIEAKSFANVNMLIKLVHIPAFIIHFIMGALGSLASIWGIGFVLFAVIIDLVTVITSGLFSVAAVKGISRQSVIEKPLAIVFGILSFIYCIDVVSAVALKITVSAKTKK